MNARVPAEVFPPGEFLREELEARDGASRSWRIFWTGRRA